MKVQDLVIYVIIVEERERERANLIILQSIELNEQTRVALP